MDFKCIWAPFPALVTTHLYKWFTCTSRTQADVNSKSKVLIFSSHDRKEIARPHFRLWALLKIVMICWLVKKIPLQKIPNSFFPSTTLRTDGQHQVCNYQCGLAVPQIIMILFLWVWGQLERCRQLSIIGKKHYSLKMYIHIPFPNLPHAPSVNFWFTFRFPSPFFFNILFSATESFSKKVAGNQ